MSWGSQNDSEIMCVNSSYVVLFQTVDGHCVTLQDFLANMVMACAGVAMMVLNGLVLHTLITCKQIDDPGNHFITNLALADCLTGLFVVYDVCYNILQYKNYVECLLRMGFFQSINICSVFTLAALTCDRYLKIFHPYYYQRTITTLRVRLSCMVIWVLSITVGMLPVLGWNSGEMGRRRVCQFFGIMVQGYLKLIIVLFYIPFGIMTIVYIRFIILARKHTQSMMTINGIKVKKIGKSIKTASIIVGTYFICWAPVGIFLILLLETGIGSSLPLSANVIFTYLFGVGLINSLLNPVIYATKIDCIKARFRRVCCSLCRRKPPPQESIYRLSTTSQLTISISRDSTTIDRDLVDAVACKPNSPQICVV